MTHRPDFRRALVGLPISLVMLGVFGLFSNTAERPKAKPKMLKASTHKEAGNGRQPRR